MKQVFPCLALVLLLTLTLTAMAQTKSAAAQEHYQKARAAEAQKNYAEAAAHYEQALQLNPSLHPLRANLGLMRYLNGEPEQAVKAFRLALAGDATLQTAHLFLGLALLDLHQPAEAITHLEAAARYKPQDLNARLQLARAYYLTDRHAQALKELQFLSGKQPDDAETLFLLGRVHLKLSLAAYEQLKEKHPDNYRIHELLGENYALQSQYGAAITNFRKAIERNPQARGLRLKLGEAHQAAGETEQALAAFQDELRLNPQDAFAHHKAGALLLEQNKPQDALPHLKRAVELDAQSGAAFATYGRCLLEMNQLPEAITQLRQAVKLDATNAAAWFQLARAYRQTGDAAAAQQALQMYDKLKDNR